MNRLEEMLQKQITALKTYGTGEDIIRPKPKTRPFNRHQFGPDTHQLHGIPTDQCLPEPSYEFENVSIGSYRAPRNRPRSRTKRAGLLFPVGRVHRHLKTHLSNNSGHKLRISNETPVYLAAVLEYLLMEVLEGSGMFTKELHKKRINPKHIMLCLRNDYELDELTSSVIIPHGGVRPFIHKQLLKRPT